MKCILFSQRCVASSHISIKAQQPTPVHGAYFFQNIQPMVRGNDWQRGTMYKCLSAATHQEKIQSVHVHCSMCNELQMASKPPLIAIPILHSVTISDCRLQYGTVKSAVTIWQCCETVNNSFVIHQFVPLL